MKKLVLFAAVIVAISFASCTGAKSNADASGSKDSTAVTTPAPAVTPTAADTAKVTAAPADSAKAEKPAPAAK